MYVDLAFIVSAQRSIPVDHGRALYEAISRLLPNMHGAPAVAIHPLAGRRFGDGRLMLMPWSALTLRLPAGQIPSVLPLVGKHIQIGEASLSIGAPQVYALEPVATLRSQLVVIEVTSANAGQITADQFAAEARADLDALGIAPDAMLTLGKRRMLHVNDCAVIGYEVIVEGLGARDSLSLQQHGLGANRHMGCGIFLRYF